MTYSTPAETTIAEMAEAVAEEGWSVVGVLDRRLSRRLLRALDEVAARSADASTAGQLHQLSGLAQHPDLAAVVDWPPLLALAVELLSPNIYINHSHLDVHPPHPPTGARRWHRDNGLMGRDMRLLWRDQPRVTLKVAVYLTDVESPDDGALEVASQSPRHGVAIPHRGAAQRSAHPRARWHGRRFRCPTLAPPTGQSWHSHPTRRVLGVQLPVADLARHPLRGRTGVGQPAWDPPSAARRPYGRPVLLGLR